MAARRQGVHRCRRNAVRPRRLAPEQRASAATASTAAPRSGAASRAVPRARLVHAPSFAPMLSAADGPVWWRGLAEGDEADDALLDESLSHIKAARMVVGHTIERAVGCGCAAAASGDLPTLGCRGPTTAASRLACATPRAPPRSRLEEKACARSPRSATNPASRRLVPRRSGRALTAAAALICMGDRGERPASKCNSRPARSPPRTLHSQVHALLYCVALARLSDVGPRHGAVARESRLRPPFVGSARGGAFSRRRARRRCFRSEDYRRLARVNRSQPGFVMPTSTHF